MNLSQIFPTATTSKLLVFLVLPLLILLNSAQANQFNLTPEEKQWIQQNPVLQVGGEPDWAPFDFVTEDNSYQGVAKDYLDIISKQTGLKLEMQIDSWNGLLDKFKQEKLDLLPAIYFSEERKSFANFTNSYSQHAEFIFTRKGQAHFQSLESLNGKTVVVVSGYSIEDYLRQNFPAINIVTRPSILKALNALLTGEADAMINDIASTSYIADKYNIVGFSPSRLLEDRINYLHMASRKKLPILASIVNKVFASISDETHQRILSKWIRIAPQKVDSAQLILTPEEKEWLAKHPLLHTTSDPSWMPYEGADKSGQFIGMFSDITQLISQRLGVKIYYEASESWDKVIDQAQQRRVDFIAAIPTKQRQAFLEFTTPLIVKELALLTNKGHSIISSFGNMERKRVALIAGYGYNQQVLKKYPNHEYVYVDSLKEGLYGLVSNKFDVFVANITSSLYYISQETLSDIQVSGTLDISFEVAYGVRKDWPMLHQIMQKALNSISEKERQEILNRWVKVDVVQKVDYTPIYQISAGITLVLLIVLFWNHKLRQEIQKRRSIESELEHNHDKLQAILDTAKSIIIVTNGKKLVNANQAFLDFFGYSSLEEFLKDQNCICDRFIENNEYFHTSKLDSAKNHWIKEVTTLPETERLVLMQGANRNYPSIFSLNVNEFDDQSDFVVSFTDITDIKIESKLHEFNATHDPLTGLFNRLYIDHFLEHELEKHNDLSEPFSIIMLDIDYFKPINDTFGHSVGDIVIKSISQVLQDTVRSNDKVARWGGEEFLIVLSGTEIDQALALAEKLRQSIETIQSDEGPKQVTCSFGLAETKAGDDIDALIRRADSGLYEAKETGRNRIVVRRK